MKGLVSKRTGWCVGREVKKKQTLGIKRVGGGQITSGKGFLVYPYTTGTQKAMGTQKSRKNLEQKFIFQLGSLSPHGIKECLSFH